MASMQLVIRKVGIKMFETYLLEYIDVSDRK